MLIEISTAYLYGDEVVLCGSNGERETVRQEYASFFARADVTDRLFRDLGASARVRAIANDGDHVRVSWQSYEDRLESVEHFARRGFAIYEGDVHPIKRALADSDLKIAKPRVALLDIETDSRVKFANREEARPLSWSVVRLDDGRHRERFLKAWHDDAEVELIKELHETLKDFDVVAAWGSPVSEPHDYVVLDARAKMFDARWRPRRVLTVDYLKVWDKGNKMAAESGDEKASLKLEDVAQAVLGHGKERPPPIVVEAFGPRKSMGALAYQLWHAGVVEGRPEFLELLLRYMWKDANLMRELEVEKGYLNLFLTLCQVSNCLPESRSLKTTALMDGYLLRHGRKHGIRWPTVVYGRTAGQQYRGAFVLDPSVRGIERDVHVIDFKSLYPSIMVTWNMSPETLVGPDFAGPVCAAATGARFRTDKLGIITSGLIEMMTGRDVFKKEKAKHPPGTPEWVAADARSTAYKQATNAWYGGIGSPYCRFYSVPIAEAVTQTGVWLIKETLSRAESREGLRACMADTDSGLLQGATFDKVTAFVKWCNDELYPPMIEGAGCTTNRVSIAYEKAYKILLPALGADGEFVAKRYAAKWSHYDGKPAAANSEPEIKGLEYKRGDSFMMARRMQKELIDLVVQDECFDVAEIEKLISRWRRHVLDEPLEVEEVVRTQALTKDDREYVTKAKKGGGETSPPVHVIVARMLKERGEDVSQGTRIEYVVVDGERTPIKAIPVDDYDGTCDRKYLWNHFVWPASARLVKAGFPGHDWDAWEVRKPNLKGGRPVPEGQLRLVEEGEPVIGRQAKRPKGSVVVRFDERRGNVWSQIDRALKASPGDRDIVVELVTRRHVAVLDMKGHRIALTPALERQLREIGCEVFDAT